MNSLSIRTNFEFSKAGDSLISHTYAYIDLQISNTNNESNVSLLTTTKLIPPKCSVACIYSLLVLYVMFFAS